MPRITKFEDMDAFKAARQFAREVGFVVRGPLFRNERELRWQIERALISILSNFAEGFERDGRQEFVQFLTISKGSLGEVRAQLIYALDQSILSPEFYRKMYDLALRAPLWRITSLPLEFTCRRAEISPRCGQQTRFVSCAG
jgi:four helix bundle protein